MPPGLKQDQSSLLQFANRFQKILITVSLLLLFSGFGLISYSYTEQRQQLLTKLAADVDEYRHAAASAGQLAESHVSLLKQTVINYYITGIGYDAAQQRQQIKPVTNTDNKITGYAVLKSSDLTRQNVTPQIITDADYFKIATNTSELNMLFNLGYVMHNSQQTNPALVWSYYFSGKKNLVAMYPWVSKDDLLTAQNYPSIAALLAAYNSYEIATKSEPVNNPDGAPHWSEPYEDAGGQGLMVSRIAPVYLEGKYLGLVGSDLLLKVFEEFITSVKLQTGRLWLVSKTGMVIADSSNRGVANKLTSISATIPWMSQADLDQTLASGENGFQRVNDHYIQTVAVPNSPWNLIYAVDNRGLFWLILPRLLPYVVMLLLLLITFIFAQWILRLFFVRPAISLATYIHTAADNINSPKPKLPDLWHPLVNIIGTAFQNAHRHFHQLEESENLKAGIIEAAPVCIISANTRCEIIEFNPEAERVFAHSANDVIGHNMTNLIIPPQFREAHARGFQRFCETQKGNILGKRIELTALRSNGDEFPIELNIVTSFRGDELIITAFIVDLSEQKQVEQELKRQRDLLHQSEKLNAMGSLLANVAHELNNPLAVVVGRSIMLEEQLRQSSSANSVTKIREAAERCVRIVRTFLAMARQKDQEQRSTQINDVLNMAIDIQGHALKTSGISVTLTLDPKLPLIHAAADQLHQVFLNLIVNAQQALAECSGTKLLHIVSYHDQNQIHVIVEDSGPGVPESIRSRIFEPYFTTKPMGVGTGIGLPVSLGVIQAHAGSITVDTSSLGGAAFHVTLPVVVSNVTNDDDDSATAKANNHSTAGKQQRLLIVDDEPEISAMLGEILASENTQIDYAENGVAALEQLAKHEYDAIFSDLRMPLLDGEALYSKIKAHYPKMANRIIFITGDALSPNIATFLSGLDAPVIEKPFIPSNIKHCLNEVLKSSRGK